MITTDTIDFEKLQRDQRRYEIARDILAAWHSDPSWRCDRTAQSHCREAVEWADALLAALEETK